MAVIFLILFSPNLIFASDTLNILFSRAVGSENYSKYCLYLQENYSKINCINAYGYDLDVISDILPQIDGLVLTGGPDVNPRYYGKEKDSSLCVVDDYRDSLEFYLIEYAFQNNIPILAICRGAQILNVYLGGTLYADLPTYFPSETVHRCVNSNNQCFHSIFIDKNTYFYSLVKEDSVLVNSFHHQGVEKLGCGLKPAAYSPDGLIEAYEWENPNNKPFIIAVQWHPERLGNKNQISKILAEKFILAVKDCKKIKNQKE